MKQEHFDQLLQGGREMKAIRAGTMAPARVTERKTVTMTALALWQPWGAAMFTPRVENNSRMLKAYETRGWAPSPRLLAPGDRLAIHGAKTQQDPKTREYLCDWWRDNVKRGARWTDFAAAGWRDWDDLPFGAIIGFGTFVGAYRTEDLIAGGKIDATEEAWGNYGPKRYGWLLRDVKRLDQPVPWKGGQSLFRVEIPEALTK